MRPRFMQFGGMPRDTQRQKLYDWEEKTLRPFDAPEDWTLDQCRAVVNWVCLDHHVDPPIVSDGRGRRRPCGSAWEIKLPRGSRNQAIVLHEVAHTLTFQLLNEEGRQEAGHGPTFVRMFIDVMTRYAKVNLDSRQMIASARAAGLKVHASSVLKTLRDKPQRKPTRATPMKQAASRPGPERLRRLFPIGG